MAYLLPAGEAAAAIEAIPAGYEIQAYRRACAELSSRNCPHTAPAGWLGSPDDYMIIYCPAREDPARTRP